MQNKIIRGWRQTLYEHPIMLIAGLFLAGVVLVLLGGLYADEREERSFVAYSERLMQTFVEQQSREMERILRDYAVWDEMADKVRGETVDLDWLKKNLTESIYRNLGIQDALVLTASMRPVYVLHRGEKTTIVNLADWNREFAATLAQKVASQPGLTSLSGVVRTNGMPQLLTVERIRPEHASAQRDQRGGWMVYARNLDPSWMEDTSRLLSIKDLALESSVPNGVVPRYPLLGLDRQPVAWFSWQVSRSAGQGSITPLLLGLIPLSLFVVLLGRAVLKMHKREIEVQSRMLQQSEALRHLAGLPHGGEDENRYLQEIANAVKTVLGVARVTLWHNQTQRGVFQCVAVNGKDGQLEGALESRVYSEYFRYLTESRTLVVEDVGKDPRVACLAEYWRTHEVVSALDTAVMIRGRLAGVLCVEETGITRVWEQDQINFVAAAADLIAVAFESADRFRTEAALHRHQFYDVLTGVPNPDKLAQMLHQHMLLPGGRVVYSLWNIGGLFHINEDLGRTCGDFVIQEIARRLELTQEAHYTARISGNRFVLALLDVSPPLIAQELERVLYRLQEPIDIAGREILPQLTCGVSLAPQDALTAEELLRHAEFALETARARSGAPIEYYAAEPNAVARERYQLAGALPAALMRGEFEVHFQPFVDLNSREIIGGEALLRWHHPEKGAIPPVQFIAIAEETGQIHALGRFVLEESCRCLREWIDRTGRQISLAVNVSPLQLRDPEFMPFIESLLQKYGLPAELLEIEITESMSIELFEHAPGTLERLHQLGVRLSIDDFGTGYSSLSYLRRLPASKLKIDRSFIEHVPSERQDADLARMIISLGRILGMTIVGEGVETDEQQQFLREQGCHIGQGYLFSRPVNALAFGLLLERGLRQ